MDSSSYIISESGGKAIGTEYDSYGGGCSIGMPRVMSGIIIVEGFS